MAKVFKAVGNVVTGVVNAVVGVVKGVVNAVVSVAKSVINMVIQPFMGLLGGAPDIPTDAGEANRQQGVLVQVNGGGAVPIPVVYGYRKMAGVTTFAETGATNNKYLWVVYTFAEGPVGGLREVFLNDEALPATIVTSLNSGVQVDIAEGKYKGRVSMLWSPGVYLATPSASTIGTTLKNGLFKDAPSFTNTMVHNGLACLFVRYEWIDQATANTSDTNPFNGSIPVIQISVLGRAVASLTTTASESYEYGAAGYVERYSTNPAEILLDYLRNPRYGKGLKNSEIDWTSWRIAAAKCNTQVTYTSSNITGPIMTCNYVLDTGQSIFNNVKILLAGFRAYLPYVQGKFKLKIEDAGNPTDILSGNATIIAECTSSYVIRNAALLENQYDIMGDVTYTGIERSAKYNAVVVTYVDPDQKWSNQQVVYPNTEAERLTYITADGGRENKLEATFPTITNPAIAWDFARMLFNKSRFQETCSLTVSSQGFELEPGDNIRIQSQILDFADTPWRVITIGYNDDLTFDLGCVRNPDYLYPYTRVGEPDTVLPIYVPKGASIYYPVEVDALPIGLVPPGSALYNTGYGGSSLWPTLANAIGALGGGVGWANSSVNTTGTNNTPPGAPKPQPLTDTLDITNVQYVTKNGLIYARLTTKQPNHVMYSGVDVYYGLNSSKGFYTLIQDTQKPGSGVAFAIDVGPLAVVSSLQATFNQYVAYFRVRYSTGDLSTKFFNLTLNPATNEGAGTNPSELVQISSSSWPALTIAQQNARDNKFDIIRFVVPSPQTNPRTGTIQFSQDVRTQAINYDVTGMNVYARSDAQTYWTKTSYTFAAGYSPGTEYSIPYTGVLGVANVGISGSTITPNGGAIYTFVFRFTYKNDSTIESTNQYVQTGAVQNPAYAASATGVNIFYGSGIRTDSRDGVVTGPSVSGVFPTTAAPPGFTANAANTQTVMSATVTSGFSSGIGFGMLLPDAANRDTWQGMKIRYRTVAPGSNEAFVTKTFYDTTFDANTYTPIYKVPEMLHNTRYEVVATPLVLYNNISNRDSNFSSHGVGLVSRSTTTPGYPTVEIGNLGPNWLGSWGWKQVDTGTALGLLAKQVDANNPVVSLSRCMARRNPILNSSTRLDIFQWIEITYNVPIITNFSKLQVYRRSRRSASTATGEPLYYGTGRWELIETTNQSGTLSLRFPISFEEFGVRGTFPPVGNVTVGYGSGVSGLPKGNATDNAVHGESRFLLPLETLLQNVQLLFRVVTTAGTSTDAVLVQGVANTTGIDNVNLISPTLPQTVTISTTPTIQDSDYVLGNKRRLSEARGGAQPLTISDLVLDARSIQSGAIAYNRQPQYYKTLGNTLPGTSTV